MTLVLIGCGIAFNPRTHSAKLYDHQVDISDVYCTYGDPSVFPFKFSLKNLKKKGIEVEYSWSLNDAQADAPVSKGTGSILLPPSEKQDIEISVKKHMDYDPRFYIMYVSVYSNDKQVGYYRGQKSTYDWDYTIIPPVRRTERQVYKHVWIDTFIEKTEAGYRVKINDILFLPPERTTKLDLDNICISGDYLLADMLADASGSDGEGFHDVDNNGELNVGDYLVMNEWSRGNTIEFRIRNEPSIHIINIGYH